jgi:hypothetical protein
MLDPGSGKSRGIEAKTKEIKDIRSKSGWVKEKMPEKSIFSKMLRKVPTRRMTPNVFSRFSQTDNCISSLF